MDMRTFYGVQMATIYPLALNKMKYIILLTVPLLLLKYSSMAQVEARFFTGYGTFQMENMRNNLKSTLTQLREIGVPLELTIAYPAFYVYQAQLAFSTPIGTFGPLVGMASTGSRISYQDYSGKYIHDELLKYRQVGLFYEFDYYSWENFSINLGMQVSGVFTNFSNSYELQIYENAFDDFSQKGKAIGIGIQPNINLNYTWHRIILSVQGGYFLNHSEPLHDEKDKEAVFTNSRTHKELQPSWNGWRAGLSLGLVLIQKHEEKID